MDEILFQSETSIRRALILCTGHVRGRRRSPRASETPLASKLLELHRNDPDAGIHSATEWALRRWNKQAELKTASLVLKQVHRTRSDAAPGWYRNVAGQTLVVSDGPVEFIMGSPASDREQSPGSETLKRITIPRRFAIATKEVTVEQFQRFVKTNDDFGLDQANLTKHSPDPDGPWITPDWYAAAAYCNWLSKEEGLPADQWCYLPKQGDAYADGMTIPADALDRKGYRLPTEAEWEYACRAGAVTTRYFGGFAGLLEKYAWYQPNSGERTRPCGTLLPNDLGLFDMLGNVYEWCHDRDPADITAVANGRIHRSSSPANEIVLDTTPRMLRGGAFFVGPVELRSAGRYNDPVTRRLM